MNWEDWLREAARRPSDHEDDKRDKTEREIRAALDAWPALAGRKWRVYVKGSYANNTNVRLNFDVDIAVEYYGFFYSELCFDLEGHDKSEVGVVTSDDPYERDDFKRDVLEALQATFGKSAVKPGNIAYRIREKKTTLPADVVPCWEYRRYDRIRWDGTPVEYIGSRVFPDKGSYINNFPKIQQSHGTAKNERTSRRYKRMVRCLKKLQTEAVNQGLLDKELPSYLIECLVYNVPDARFGSSSYLDDMRNVLAFLWSGSKVDGEWNDWQEVHELHYLFRGTKSWTRSEVHNMVNVVWDMIGIN